MPMGQPYRGIQQAVSWAVKSELRERDRPRNTTCELLLRSGVYKQ